MRISLTCLLPLTMFLAVTPALAQSDSWRGGYVGGSLGYGLGYSANSWRNEGAGYPEWQVDGDITYGSLTGSVYGGYLVQNGNLVGGVEADVSLGQFKGDDSQFAGRLNEIEMNVVATLRGRLGWSIDNFLLYGTAGVAFTELDKRDVWENTTNPRLGRGWVAGGGAEMVIDESWRARVEYLYTQFGPIETPILFPASGLGYEHRADAPALHLLRAGLTYRF